MIKPKSFLNCRNPQTYAIIVSVLYVCFTEFYFFNLPIRFARCCVFKEKTWAWLKRHFHGQAVSHRFMFPTMETELVKFQAQNTWPGCKLPGCLQQSPSQPKRGFAGRPGFASWNPVAGSTCTSSGAQLPSSHAAQSFYPYHLWLLFLAKILAFSAHQSWIKNTKTESGGNRKGALILSQQRGNIVDSCLNNCDPLPRGV